MADVEGGGTNEQADDIRLRVSVLLVQLDAWAAEKQAAPPQGPFVPVI